MNVLILTASARQDSVNKRLAAAVHAELRASPSMHITQPDFKAFAMPMYDGDLEQADGVPEAARELGRLWSMADAVILCTPEYNGGMPGTLKNAIDWVSRLQPHPIASKWLLLTGASPGALGAVRGLWHTRVPFEALGAFVFPEMFGLASAASAFDEQGQLKDAAKAAQLKRLLNQFLSQAQGTKLNGP